MDDAWTLVRFIPRTRVIGVEPVRGGMLRRDLRAHLARGANASATLAAVTSVKIPDSTCQQCHDPGRAITMRYGTLIKHTEHAKRNKSCISCHLWTGHPDPNADRPLLLMSQCFNCQAGGGPWVIQHPASAAKLGAAMCFRCHEPTFCVRCHVSSARR